MAYFLYTNKEEDIYKVKDIIKENFSKIAERDGGEIYSDDKKRFFQIFDLNSRGYKIQIGDHLDDLTIKIAETLKKDFVVDSLNKKISIYEIKGQ